MKKYYENRTIKYLLLFIFAAFYLFFAFLDGPAITRDSPSYIQMGLSREPLYPSFLALNRMLFGEEKYFNFVIILQSLLWAFSNWYVVIFLKRTFNFKWLFTLMSVFVCIAPSLFLRFIAARGYLYSTVIMTEGVCIPLFLLFATLTLKYIFEGSRLQLIAPTLISLILISNRKQMYVTLILLVLAIFFTELSNKGAKARFLKGLITALVAAAIVLVGNRGIEYAYSYSLRGELATHSSDDRFFATVAFFVSEREDAEAIEDPTAKELFLKIYDICDAEGDMLHSATGNIMEKIEYYGDHYDCIQIDHMWPEIESYVINELGITDDIQREEIADDLMNKMMYGVLPKVWPRFLYVFAASFLHGFVNTVATTERVILHYAALALALLYVLLLIISIRYQGMSKSAKMGLYTMFSVGVNIALVSVVIFCQNRYMIYNMSLFYLTLLVMMHELLTGKKRGRK